MEVAQLWRRPVEGTEGESTPSVRVDVRGFGGDRTHAILAAAGKDWRPVTAAGWRSAYPFAPGGALDPAKPPYAVLTSPDGRQFRWGDPRLRTALEDDLGVAVRLHRDPDTPRIVLVATTAAPVAHANLLLDADVDWRCAAELHFEGGVRLRILGALAGGGARARALANGRIAAGEPVELIAS